MEFLELLQQQNKTISDLLNKIDERDNMIRELQKEISGLEGMLPQ